MKLEADWGRHRRTNHSKLTEEQATDIILNCDSKDLDEVYAIKYGLSPVYVKNLRAGKNWADLRSRLGQ